MEKEKQNGSPLLTFSRASLGVGRMDARQMRSLDNFRDRAGSVGDGRAASQWLSYLQIVHDFQGAEDASGA